MREYDYILAGAGTAGLSLAYHLLQSSLDTRSMLIVDQCFQHQEERTWGYWTNQPLIFDDIVYRSWEKLQIKDDLSTKILPLHSYSYQVIRGSDFYPTIQRKLSSYANVDFLEGRIEKIEDTEHFARLIVDRQCYKGQWIFDSRFQLPYDQSRSLSLQQQFQGWEIETEKECFDPQIMTFFDFSTPQERGTSFFYLLPYSERHALVMFVLWTETPVYWNTHDMALQNYVQRNLGMKKYAILHEEHGTTLLTDYLFPRQRGMHVLTIGKPGGRVKPSTGYAFARIQQDSAAIVKSLTTTGHPFDIPPSPHRFRYFDSVFLHILSHHPDQVKTIFTSFLVNQPVERGLRFLDERGSLWENLSVVPALPPGLLFQTILSLGTFLKV